MEQISIHPETIPSMQSETTVPITAITPTAFFLEKPNLVCNASTGVSKRFTRDVRPAKPTAMKNITITILPPGICAKTLGRKMNMSPGPPVVSSCPAVAMAGIMVSAAISAATVSHRATFFAL